MRAIMPTAFKIARTPNRTNLVNSSKLLVAIKETAIPSITTPPNISHKSAGKFSIKANILSSIITMQL
jgi:hypothetical protein